MIQRQVTEVSKLAIFWFVRGLSGDFSVRAPKYRADDNHHKKTEDDDLEECDSMLLFGHVLGYNGVK